MPKAAFYAVKVGRKPGIYDTWTKTTAQVQGFPNAKHQKFKSRKEAEAFLTGSTSHSSNGHSVAGPSQASRTSTTSKGSQRQSAALRSSSPLSSLTSADLPEHLRELAAKGYTFCRSSADQKGKGKEKLVVYCDGSGLSNGKVGARAGAGVWWGSRGEAAESSISERVPGKMQTNNRGEILAVILALEQCPYPNLPLQIRTDSQYTIKCMTEYLPKWLANNFRSAKGEGVKNEDIIKHLLVLLRRRPPSGGVSFKYVPAHVGVEGNEAADRLAKRGAEMPAVRDRLHWLDPEVVHDHSSEAINIDVEVDPDLLMTFDEMAAFDIAPDEEF